MRTRCLLSSVAICAMMVVGAFPQTSPTPSTDTSTASRSAEKTVASQLSVADRQFVRKAAEGGLAEVELGKLAADRASIGEVKKFGQRMVDDHSKANDRLKQIASSKGVTVAEDLNAKDKATKARLARLSGTEFDRAYMNDMIQDHVQDVAEFNRESKIAKDPDVKNFAAQTLLTLQDHLKDARNIAAQTGARAAIVRP